MAEKRTESLLVRAHPPEQAERISRSMVEVRVVDARSSSTLTPYGEGRSTPLWSSRA